MSIKINYYTFYYKPKQGEKWGLQTLLYLLVADAIKNIEVL
jgi:hypothetical protein